MAGKVSPNSVVHRLINAERRKRGLSYVRWSQEMYRFAKSQANYCAKVGRLVHSNRPALRGGENLFGGKGNMSPHSIVKCWMNSKAGHREWLLDPRVKVAGVGISKSKHGTYAAWAFSDQSLSLPIKIPKLKIPFIFKTKSFSGKKVKGGAGMLRLPVKIVLLVAAIVAIVLGAHGVWVYFSSLELFFGAEASKLFLALEVPSKLRPMIEWMSMKGFQSWFIPAVFIVLGIILWQLQTKIDTGNQLRWLRKLHLW